MKVFVDTGGWISVQNTSDKYHLQGKAYFNMHLLGGTKLVTSNFVLDELITYLRYNIGFDAAEQCWDTIQESVSRGYLSLIIVDDNVQREAFQFMKKFRDQDFSFTDCTSFAVCRREQADEVFAFDHHFTVAGFIVKPSIAK